MSDRPLSTIESVAVAVLRGDLIAARALVDLVLEEYTGGAVPVVPVQKVTVDRDRLRIAVFIDPDLKQLGRVEVDADGTKEACRQWLEGTSAALVMNGVQRIELYELPERFWGTGQSKQTEGGER